jgi:hypothetical protein
VSDVGLGLAYRDHPNYRELRYEDLVADVEGTLKALFESLDVRWAPEVLAYHERNTKLGSDPGFKKPIFGSSVGRWRRDLTRDERAVVQRIAGPLLVELGYAEDDSWVDETEPHEATA